tara:strand:+ start:20829 stop:23036 length:2208 start_codon:yes stop_codon:yes gene_type:complete
MYVRYSLKVEFIICLQDVTYLGETTPENSSYYPNIDSNGKGSSTNTSLVSTGVTNDKNSIDPALAYLRRRLMQPARHLRVSDMGFGYELNINDPLDETGLHDVDYGPKPRSLTWKPIAANKAATIQYEIDFCIPECESWEKGVKEQKPSVFNLPETGGALPVEVMGATYNQSWAIDEAGQTIKSYQCILKIRGYVDPNDLTSILRSADEYRQYFEPNLVEGFIRTRKYSLNEDKSQLTIDIEDKEHETSWPLPPGVPDISVDYTIQSGISINSAFNDHTFTGWQIWKANLSGRMRLAKGFDPYYRRIYPYYVFLLIIRSRFNLKLETGEGSASSPNTYSSYAGGESGFGAFESGDKVLSMPVSFTLSESVFGRDFSFNFTWELIGCRPQEAPFILRFGADPTRYMEQQATVMGGNQHWTWNLWRQSLYYDKDNDNYYFQINIEVPSDNYPPARNTRPKYKNIKILENWKGVERPAFNMRGARGLSFEGDSRQEPCQPSPDFWYKVNPKTNKSFKQFDTPDVINKNYDKNYTILSTESSVETIESHSNAVIYPLNSPNGGDTLIGESQDGNTAQAAGSSYPQQPPLATGAVAGIIPLSGSEHIGDRHQVADTTTSAYSATSKKAPVAQSYGPTMYTIRVTGQALSTGLPVTPPRTMRWGQGYAVCKSKRNEVTRKGGGEIEIWQSKWHMEYDIIGSPNGLSPVALSTGHDPQMNQRLVKSPIFTKSQTNFMRTHYT